MKSKKLLKVTYFFAIIFLVFGLVGCGVPDEIVKKNNSYFNITFIDVGQGDSALVECDGHRMLIDGGPSSSSDKVYSVVENKDIKNLDYLVLSHLHEDHIGGLKRMLSYTTSIDKVFSNNDYADTEIFRTIEKELLLNDSKIEVVNKGNTYKLGSADIEILDVGNEGNESVVLLITYGETKFLFTGDMSHNMESRLCEKYDDEYKINLLKVSHHGSGGSDNESTSIRFLRMLMPEYAIISVGENNKYGHPHKQTLDRLEQADCEIYRTDIHGDIFVKSDGKNLKVSTQK